MNLTLTSDYFDTSLILVDYMHSKIIIKHIAVDIFIWTLFHPNVHGLLFPYDPYSSIRIIIIIIHPTSIIAKKFLTLLALSLFTLVSSRAIQDTCKFLRYAPISICLALLLKPRTFQAKIMEIWFWILLNPPCQAHQSHC